jgi:alpha-N-arabinofuranosidase
MGLIRTMLAALALAAPAQALEARFDGFAYRGLDPQPAVSAGQYRNPTLAGFYPDPTITRVGADYYFAASTFAYFPGLPIFTSRDLVHWRQVGNAIDRPGQLDFTGLGLSRGVFAPDLTWRDGTFYLLNTCVDCGGNYLLTARDAAGPWSDPIWIREVDGIDPSFFFDDDGRTYLLNNGPPEGTPLYDGHRAIWMQEFDLKAMTPVGPRRVLVNGGVDLSKKPVWIEGPHIYKKDGWYVLSCAEGGTSVNHSQVALRSRNVWGPYVPFAGNPILTQRDLPADRPDPITSAGHADLVEGLDGGWWATFLATRPYRDDFYNTGRETFLLPVTWTDGWPSLLPAGTPIPQVHAAPQAPAGPQLAAQSAADAWRETFDGPLGPAWMTLRTPKTRWSRIEGGALVLQARSVALGSLGQPSYWGRRQQHLSAQATTRVAFRPAGDGDRAGLAALQSEDFFYLLSVGREGGGRVVRLERRAGRTDPPHGTVLARAPLPDDGPVELRITARRDRYDFAYAVTPGRWTPLLEGADGTLLSTHTAGGFVGVTFGLYAFSDETP